MIWLGIDWLRVLNVVECVLGVCAVAIIVGIALMEVWFWYLCWRWGRCCRDEGEVGS